MTCVRLNLYLAVLAIVVCVSSCDPPTDGPNNPLRTSGTDLITGIVVDQTHTGIDDVEVISDGAVLATTNREGEFSFDSGDISDGDLLIFKIDGYVTVSKIFRDDSKLKIFMKGREEAVVFESADGRTIELESGLELDFPADAFELNGAAYDGEVSITATYFDPENNLDLISAPAPFIEQKGASDDLIPLSTFGVLEVLAFTPDDEELQLAADVKVDVVFPAIAETPSEVNLYELDPEVGFWSLSSNLDLVGSQLQGVITSVNSSWNADDPCSDQLICVKVKIEWTNGDPGCGIGATGVTYQGFDGLYSPDENGEVQLLVCPDAVFELGACWSLCCGPGVPASDPCCNNPQHKRNIDMSTVTLNPNGCTDLGTWTINN